jgi:hypothetical protein
MQQRFDEFIHPLRQTLDGQHFRVAVRIHGSAYSPHHDSRKVVDSPKRFLKIVAGCVSERIQLDIADLKFTVQPAQLLGMFADDVSRRAL